MNAYLSNYILEGRFRRSRFSKSRRVFAVQEMDDAGTAERGLEVDI